MASAPPPLDFAAATQAYIAAAARPSCRARACADAAADIARAIKDSRRAAAANTVLAEAAAVIDREGGDWCSFLEELKRADAWRADFHGRLGSAGAADLVAELPELCDSLLLQAELLNEHSASPPLALLSPWQEGVKKALAEAPAFGRREEFVDLALGLLAGFSGPAGGPNGAALWQKRLQAEVRGLPAFGRDAEFVDCVLSKLAHFNDVAAED